MRAYIRLDPDFYVRMMDRGVPDSVIVTFLGALCAAEKQVPRGRFVNELALKAHLEKRHWRHIATLLADSDLVSAPDGFYLDGWDEWQEGNFTPADRRRAIESRHSGEPFRQRGAGARSSAEKMAAWRLRTKVFERDGFRCRYCGDAEYERRWLVLDHIDPHGPSSLDNLATACRRCNKKKGDRTPAEAGMTLLPVTDLQGNVDGSRVTGHSNARATYAAESGELIAESRRDAARDTARTRSVDPDETPRQRTGNHVDQGFVDLRDGRVRDQLDQLRNGRAKEHEAGGKAQPRPVLPTSARGSDKDPDE